MDALTFPFAVDDAWFSGMAESATRSTSFGSPISIATLITSWAPAVTVMLVRTWVLKPAVSTVIS